MLLWITFDDRARAINLAGLPWGHGQGKGLGDLWELRE